VRELNVLSFAEAVHKMSGLAAETFRLGRYGRIEPGAQANIVVFDPQTVIDRATFEDSKQFPRGIEHVIVEGELMIRSGEQRGSGSGVVVRSGGTVPPSQ
jgi:N-acyl-D-amino-acid deacylase